MLLKWIIKKGRETALPYDVLPGKVEKHVLCFDACYNGFFLLGLSYLRITLNELFSLASSDVLVCLTCEKLLSSQIGSTLHIKNHCSISNVKIATTSIFVRSKKTYKPICFRSIDSTRSNSAIRKKMLLIPSPVFNTSKQSSSMAALTFLILRLRRRNHLVSLFIAAQTSARVTDFCFTSASCGCSKQRHTKCFQRTKPFV